MSIFGLTSSNFQALVSVITHLTAAPIECTFSGSRGLRMEGSILALLNRNRRKRDKKRGRCGEEQSRDPYSFYQVFCA